MKNRCASRRRNRSTLVLGLAVWVTLVAPAGAAIFVVTSTDDAADVLPGDGVCRTATGVCTLRAAILEANALPGADTITLPAGTFRLSLAGGNEDAGATGDLDITDDLVVNGAGESASTVSGNYLDRIFDVHTPAQASLSGMTITAGKPPPATDGGGVLNDGTLTLTNVTLVHNQAGPGYGWAGAFKNLGTATLLHVSFVDNHAGDGYCFDFAHCDYSGSAGGMWNVGTVALTDVTFRRNRTGTGVNSSDEFGGGMWNDGTASLDDVTFLENRATGDFGSAGGFMNLGTATLTHVTFSRNRAADVYCAPGGDCNDAGSAGAMWNEGTVTLNDVAFRANRGGDGGLYDSGGDVGGLMNLGDATLTNVTFSLNRAGRGGTNKYDEGNVGGSGGGMMNGCPEDLCEPGATATLTNVVFDRNRAGNGQGGFEGGGNGGGMQNYGSATFSNVRFTGNRAGSDPYIPPLYIYDGEDGGDGGGLWNAGTATITDAVFDRNRAGAGRGPLSSGGSGGGIYDCGTLTLTNVAITRNLAGDGIGLDPEILAGNGGGIESDTATLTNVTVAFNRAGQRIPTHTSSGAGNQIWGGASLVNTIVLGAGESCASDPMFGGNIVSLGHNLDSGSTCGFAAPGDLSSTDPRLASQTLLPLPGSPVIDAGDDDVCPPTDVRGIPRPQGAACDIGAYEFRP